MLGESRETPSRYELLNVVKKHSKLLGQTTVDEQDASDVEMDYRFWRDVMNLYFVLGRESRKRQDDDLIFFVRKMSFHGHGANHNLEDNSPYFVRRWASKLDDLVDENTIVVDWRRSFYLNLIAHTTFSVTVAICSHQALRNHQSGETTSLSPIYKSKDAKMPWDCVSFSTVWNIWNESHEADKKAKKKKAKQKRWGPLKFHLCTYMGPLWIIKNVMDKLTDVTAPLHSENFRVVKTVYASPSRVNFHLDSRKEVETTPAYPDICFAVDDFDSTFDAVVLTDTDHCYCVLLNAHGGAAFPDKKASQDCSSSDSSSMTISTDAGKTNKTKLTLFSGFVSYQMVREAYDAGRSGFGSLLSLGQSSGKTDKLYMKGPGGRGEVEVAVSGVLDQSMQGSSPHSPGQFSKKVPGFGEIVRRAANVASVAAKNAYAAAGASRGSDNEMLPLKCCLMSISLPWECIAQDLLLKGSPPVNL